MSSETSIANLALVSHLGCQKITNLNDESTEAIAMEASFNHCRDTLLEEGMWGFANRRDIWTPLAEAPLWGFSFAYQIPSTTIRMLTVSNNPTNQNFNWKLEGDKILCNADQIFVKYTERVTNTDLFTTGFANALAMYLAYYNCIGLTENRAMKEELYREYNNALDDARTNDGMQGKAEKILSNSLLDARRGGRSLTGLR